MKNSHATKVSLIYFLFFYVFIYAGNAVYGTFLPLYFQDIGFSALQIGTLLSFGPFVAILAQPLWGALGDRARTKNFILLILLAGCGISMILYPLSNHFTYLLIMICIFTFFQTSIFAISDTITLEVLDKRKMGSFGHIRMGGTIGFAIMSLVFGIISKNHIGSLFAVYSSIIVVCFLLVLKFPSVEGHQSQGRKMSILVLFRNRMLMVYFGINFILQITLGYYYAFFPMYFRELGGDNVLLGWSMVISSLSEVPFLLFADKIFKRVRIPYILLGAACFTALRWYLFSVIETPIWALPVQALHGLIFIVLTVTMATYINKEVPKELKASGQTFNGLMNLGVARIIGSLAGGIATTSFGLRRVFMYNSIIALVCVAVFAMFFWRMRNRESSAAKQAN
ncbi:PPP family 3-phenylpropionic acid transporter [Paenibacillus castaneae]|uniref:MFS transporter n=1 Tax=Paenibacillus castaneae TaxID=474957 RepID=UPI000C9CEAB7|nr:MFS transporter [Paenibacillus castaneae]NIK75299.1 PPP family 3-phenylpropionic acid transporter [Paenibacillus castaneae]